MLTRRDVLLYVHIPFCNSKCRFCYWVSKIPKDHLLLKTGSDLRDQYVEALIQQISNYSQIYKAQSQAPRLLYFGGGTPGVLSNDEIARIFSALKSHYDFSLIEDLTFETTPETIDFEKAQFLKELGFNRMSFGVQSFNDSILKNAGRLHTEAEAIAAVESCAKAGFKNLNVDLIAGLPKENFELFARGVDLALSLPINHISVYPFRVTPETSFYNDIRKKRAAPVDYELQIKFYNYAKSQAIKNGFEEYSLYYFGKKGAQSRACMSYFHMHMDWLGFGSGATSLIEGRFLRTAGFLPTYIKSQSEFEQNALLEQTDPLNLLFLNSLTTPRGVNYANWVSRGLRDVSVFEKNDWTRSALNFLREKNYLEEDSQGFRIRRDRLAEGYIKLTQYQANTAFGLELERPVPELFYEYREL